MSYLDWYRLKTLHSRASCIWTIYTKVLLENIEFESGLYHRLKRTIGVRHLVQYNIQNVRIKDRRKGKKNVSMKYLGFTEKSIIIHRNIITNYRFRKIQNSIIDQSNQELESIEILGIRDATRSPPPPQHKP